MDNNDLIEKFHKTITDEDLLGIDECMQKGLIIDRSYSYWYKHSIYTSTKDFTPLISAVECQSVKVVEHLLKKGAIALIKSKEGDKTPLSVAVNKGNLEIVRLLVENGAKASMQTALLDAIEKKNLDIVRYMVENGAFVNWNYKSGHTPLSKSIRSRCGEISKFLIDNGSNIEELGIDNCTPLVLSVEAQMLDILKYLLQKGANINQIDDQGRTALSVAASNKNYLMSTYLIGSGANIRLAQEAVDEYASKDEDFDVYIKLLKMGQLELKNSEGEKATVTLLDAYKQFLARSGQEEASLLPK